MFAYDEDMSGSSRRRFVQAAALAAAVPGGVAAAELRPETLLAFAAYIRERERRLEEERLKPGSARFLWLDDEPRRREAAKAGRVAIEAALRKNPREVKGGLIHDWAAGVFLPGVTLEKVLKTVQDYDQHKRFYAPEVMDSKLLARQGDEFRIYYRLKKKKVITAVLNSEHDAKYFALGGGRVHSRSYSTKIAEVEHAGEAGERELAPEDGHGFLWRLYSYWRFAERDGGVYVECEAVSLTRGIPFGLGWMIEPIIRDLPQESLERMMAATRVAVKG